MFSISIIILSIFCGVTYCNSPRDRKMTEILESVRRMEELLGKEERLREITDIVRIDSTMDKINKKLDRVEYLMEQGNSIPATGRSESSTSVIPRDLATNLASIDNRLKTMETAVDNIEETVGKQEFSLQKIEEIERRTTQLKDDMNQKLRKMMNVITALYEMNKDIKVNFGSKTEKEPEPKQEGDTNYAAEFFVENLEELERKIKEQFSVLNSDIRSEITSLKIVASTMSNCNTPQYDENEWLTPENNARSLQYPNRQTGRSSSKVEDTLENIADNLSRTTREIREEIHQGMQGIDDRLENLMVIAQKPRQCDPLASSESIVNERRVDPFVRPPQQSLEDKPATHRSESCSKVARNVSNPKSCADLRKGGATCDGIYVIFPQGVRAVRVLCDMTTEGGGWTVLLRRGDYGDKMTSFHKNWLSYKNGFGDTEGEFWLGNDVMHLMTSEDDNRLRVHLSAFDGDQVNLDYLSFSVANESSNYTLHIGVPSAKQGAAANSLRYHNNHPFSTYDKKNDDFTQNCAAMYKGGWWFNGCYFGFLTGEYFRPDEKRENWQGILWYDWKGNASLKKADMMIRPKSFH